MRLLPKNETYRSTLGSFTDPQELDIAQRRLFYHVQQESFPTEKKSQLKRSSLSSASKLLQFSPFIGPMASCEQLVEQTTRKVQLLRQTPSSA